MKSLNPNQKQLIRNQWEIFQLIAAGAGGAAALAAGEGGWQYGISSSATSSATKTRRGVCAIAEGHMIALGTSEEFRGPREILCYLRVLYNFRQLWLCRYSADPPRWRAYKVALPFGGGEQLSRTVLSRDPLPHTSLHPRVSKCFMDLIGKYQHLDFTGN